MHEGKKDIRYIQRFSNYKKAFEQLTKFIEKKELSDMEKQGLIKSFEYTYELAWNTLKDYLEYQGETNITGARDTFREAYEVNLIAEGDKWMDMLMSRNKTSHTYNEETAEEITKAIINTYFALFKTLKEKIENLISKQ
ncbi:MAG: nucleotidyltransferase substrate binding protein [Spirochaetia bacterium]|nr:nucleotidyltransferase substrate binding protein [Spirochaetia bacterium]